MSASDAVKEHIVCPICHHPFVCDVWRIIDFDREPQLAEHILQGALHHRQCPKCRQLIGIDASALVLRRSIQPALYFRPAQSASVEQNTGDLKALLTRLGQVLGAEAEALMRRDVVVVPSSLLPLVISRDLDRDLNAPEAVDVEGDQGHVYQQFLRLHAEAKVQEFLRLPGWRESQRHVERNPELLTDLAFRAFEALMTAAQSAHDQTQVGILIEHQHILQRARDITIASAFREHAGHRWASRFRAGKLSPEVIDALGRIELAEPTDAARLVELCRAALTVVCREAEPALWGGLLAELGANLAASPGGRSADILEEAVGDLETALPVLIDAALPEEVGKVRHNLGGVLLRRVKGDRRDNIEKAIEHLTAALEVRRQEPTPFKWAMTVQTLAVAYSDRLRGDPAENLERAIHYLEAASNVFTRAQHRLRWAQIQNNLGAISYERLLHDDDETIERAISHYEAALQVFAELQEVEEWAQTANNLGAAYVARRRGTKADNIEVAIQHLEAALEQRTRAKSPIEWAVSCLNLAQAQMARVDRPPEDNLATAVSLCQGAIEVFDAQGLHMEWARAHFILATWYASPPFVGRPEYFDNAVAHYRAALERYTPETAPQDARRAARDLGSLYFNAGRFAEAANAYATAIEAAEGLYSIAILPSSRQAHLSSHGRLYRDAAYAYAQIGKLERAAEVLELGRARWLAETVAQDRRALERLQSIDTALYHEFIVAAEQLRVLEVAQWGHERRDLRPRMTDDLIAQARAARGRLSAAVAAIRRHAGYESFLAGSSLGDVAAAVEPGVPLVYIITSDQGTLALLASRPAAHQSLRLEVLPIDDLTTDDLERHLVQWEGPHIVGGYVPGQLGHRHLLDTALDALLPELGERMAKPLAARLQDLDVREVVLIPTGRLGLLPLHAACWHEADQIVYFMDRVCIRYAPSARFLRAALSSVARRQHTAPVLVGVANPLPNPVPLAYADLELRTIATHFPTDRRMTLYGPEATRQALLEAAASATHVHCACHGVFEHRVPLDSSLHLAGGEVLRLRDLFATQAFASVRLVCLSACQSAITDFNDLPDEGIGWPAGFLHAGVAGVVGTLWAVHDLSTTLVMERFYAHHLRGMEPAAALLEAQQWLRGVTAGALATRFEQERKTLASEALMSYDQASEAWQHFTYDFDEAEHPYAHPAYWAAFACIGL